MGTFGANNPGHVSRGREAEGLASRGMEEPKLEAQCKSYIKGKLNSDR